jgi:2-succinyl-5-enolpyruvyl-6-hydroxy-3-cyclohexene-1-carboxylate synthase
MFGAAYAAVDTLVDFRREFQRSITAQDSRLIEVLTDAVFHEKIRKEIMHDAVDPGQSL